VSLALPEPAATAALGRRLAAALLRTQPARAWLVTLAGPLGAGKTTLVRGLLAGLGCTERVRSPTYTLVEPYELDGLRLAHLDLYRLAEPEELEFLGVSDLAEEGWTRVVEWPERGAGWLGEADLALTLDFEGAGRRVRLEALTPPGRALLQAVLAQISPGGTQTLQ
jgi:tRNA threonylcarbamoyladenosine biosynthesis protein TsaE